MIGELPSALEVCGKRYGINADYRNILRIIDAMNDERLTDRSKLLVCVRRLYTEPVPQEYLFEAYKKAKWFIDGGSAGNAGRKESVRLVDFEQDEPMLFAALNSAAREETRALPFMHWWTFLGLYISLPPDSLFARVVQIRSKLAKKKKLEKWEDEFYRANKELIDLKRLYSPEQQAEVDRLNEILG